MASEDIIHKQTEIQEPTTGWYRLRERLAPYPFIAPLFYRVSCIPVTANCVLHLS